MSAFVIGLAVLLGATSAAVAGTRFVRAWWRARGARLITCPENHEPASIVIDAVGAGLAAAVNEPVLHLRSCSRWPERRNCNQACLSQVAEAPDGCLARARVTEWYEGKACVFCRAPIGRINWIDHQPALRAPDGVTLEWDRVPIERLPEVLASHQPVCWSCHVAESFRRRFPDTIVDREETPLRDSVIH